MVIKSKSKKPKQLELEMPTWGGKRDNAGRKPSGPRSRVQHTTRRKFHRDHPIHVTLRMREGLPSLRHPGPWAVIVDALKRSRGRFGMSVTDYSVMGNHLHLLVEAEGCESLSRGMRGFVARLVKGLNRCFGSSGNVFADRYHTHVLSSPLEVRRALAYVLLNYRKHAFAVGRRIVPHWLDPRSSALAFCGWRDPVPTPTAMPDLGVAEPRTWLRRVGWRKHGLLRIDEIPGQPEQVRRAA